MNIPFCFVATIQLVFFLKLCNTDIVLNNFKHIHIHKEAPKIWHKYIKGVIYKYLKQNDFPQIKSKHLPKLLFKQSALNLKLKTKKLKEEIITCDNHMPLPPYIIHFLFLEKENNKDCTKSLDYYLLPHPLLIFYFTFNLISSFFSWAQITRFPIQKRIIYFQRILFCFLSLSKI